MKTAIYGAGALGTVMGALLTQKGVDIDLITRNAEHARAMKEHGAVIYGLINETIPVHSMTPDEMQERYDIIFLMTKQMQNRKDAEFLLNYLSEDGVICVLQNGIPEPELAQCIGEDRVIGGIVTWNAVRTEAGRVFVSPPASSLSFSVGTISGARTPQLLKVQEVLSQMCMTEIVDNLMGLRWSKLIINACLSCPATILGGKCGDVLDDPQWRRVAMHILHECVTVGHAAGVEFVEIQGCNFAKELDFVTEEEEQRSLALAPECFSKYHPGVPSMLGDLQKGRPCEIDALVGVICRMGREHGIATPFSDMAVRTVKDISEGKITFSKEHVARFVPLFT
ncbi:ketopantoate reductase family protein [Lawsonibacter sp. LCP25S3_G6]|uniref:ketopantoate reductase family protein n=1 Tax=unclassified Lawsonibacter TaxID=2617946 RepID=UPI003F999C26